MWPIISNDRLSKVFEPFYLNEELSDVTFICARDESNITLNAEEILLFDEKIHECIPAHNFILSASSDVFKTIINGPLAKTKEKNFTRFTSAGFKNFLQFFYMNEVKIKPENFLEILSLVHEYDLQDVLELCIDSCIKNMNDDDVCAVFAYADKLCLNDLKEHCERKISANPLKIFETDGFFNCRKETVKKILHMSTFICRQADIIKAALKWAVRACEKNELNIDDPQNMDYYFKELLRGKSFNTFKNKKNLSKIMFGNLKKDEIDSHLNDSEEYMRKNIIERNELFKWNDDYKHIHDVIKNRQLFKQLSSNNKKINTTIKPNRTILLGGIFFNKYIIPEGPDSVFGHLISLHITQLGRKLPIKKIEKYAYNNSDIYVNLRSEPILLIENKTYCISYQFDETFFRRNPLVYHEPFSYTPTLIINDELKIQMESVHEPIINQLIFNIL